MGIQELGSIGEFIAAIATICTLFYLAYQIRESSKVDKGSSYHQAVEQTWHSVLAVVNNPELRDMVFRTQQGETLTDQELHQLQWLNIAFVYGFENIFRLKEEGLVDEEVWQNLKQNDLANWFRVPQNWEFLCNRKGPLTERFRKEIMTEIGEN
jgi:hypothetical protein